MSKRRITYDNINRTIIAELLKDANIKIRGLSKKIKVPLSTVQRRVKTVTSSSLLKKRFHLDSSSYFASKEVYTVIFFTITVNNYTIQARYKI
jgi:DNA-binding Lrp family transcriptional regulator